MIHNVDLKSVNHNCDLKNKLAAMFEEIDNAVLLSYLHGHMGTAWVDNLVNPSVAQVTVGIFVFFAGDASAKEAVELLHNLPDYTLAIVHTDEWKRKIELVHKGRNEKFQRYRFKKNPQDLDLQQLHSFRSALPSQYDLKKIDSKILANSSFHELSEDFISQFNDSSDFLERGIGFCISHNGKEVCAATSFSIFDAGIEIEIATDPEFRRKGLATVVASTLMLYCLENGIYPSWDAANLESADLAKKLGYVMDSEYDTYFINSEAARNSSNLNKK